jgi:cell division protein FtsI (penicillin-binding protein 3)
METKTGYIRAMANLSKTENGNYEEVYNHALGRSTEPGSTFKLASMMVGIEQGYINLNDTVGTNDGTYRFHDRIMRDSKEGGYGKISAQDGFAFSSNVAISRLVHKAFASQPEKFVEGISKLGIAQKTGISIIGEVDPFIRKPSETGWSGISLPWMSIGYETRFTPLQILNLYNAVANNGVMVRPQLVQEFRRGKDVVKKFEPEIINPQIASPRTIAAARKMLEAVVDYGTGKKLQAANFRIAGKTGTTQIAQDGGGYGNGSGVRHQASFVGYFPAEDPIFTAIVVIAAPTKNIYGAEVSGTVFKAIADKVYSGSLQYHAAINDQPNSTKVHLPTTKNGYQTEIKTVLSHLNIPMQSNTRDSDWVVTESTNKLVNLRAKNVSTNMVPDVRGMSLKDALYLIENMGMLAKATGAGKITAQSIAPGTAIRGEMIIELTLK